MSEDLGGQAPGADLSITHAGGFWEQGSYRKRTKGDQNLARAVLVLEAFSHPMLSRPDLDFPQLREIAQWLCELRASYQGYELERRIDMVGRAKTTTTIQKTEAPRPEA